MATLYAGLEMSIACKHGNTVCRPENLEKAAGDALKIAPTHCCKGARRKFVVSMLALP